jgi:hypothetical protein
MRQWSLRRARAAIPSRRPGLRAARHLRSILLSRSRASRNRGRIRWAISRIWCVAHNCDIGFRPGSRTATAWLSPMNLEGVG